MPKQNKTKIDQIISRMQQARVAVVGDLMLDRYIWGDVNRISPEAPVPVVRLSGESSNLGGAANVAANVGALGAKVLLFGVAGEGADGKHLLKLLQKNGFITNGIVTTPKIPTTVKTRIIAGSQHIVRIDREMIEPFEKKIHNELLLRFQEVKDKIDVVILEDYNKGVLTPSFIQEIISSCCSAGIPVGVDPKRDNFWDYRGATLFKPNLRELEDAVGHSLAKEDDLIDAGKKVQQKLEVKHLLVTRGKEGMALFTNGEVQLIQTQAHRVHDVSGAGDTVIATIMTALAGGADIVTAANLANSAASIVIAEVGAVPVDIDKLRQSWKTNNK
ncbi:MAG: D-glycero-beta-D-manno-heptose-7-phosphate kinase [Candidatus Hatepunaea meridiana]|nr:D-glycero-beta-D-manno-heptose-7-phosphate kinase [Candidatus Hatepunaea meridiana]